MGYKDDRRLIHYSLDQRIGYHYKTVCGVTWKWLTFIRKEVNCKKCLKLLKQPLSCNWLPSIKQGYFITDFPGMQNIPESHYRSFANSSYRIIDYYPKFHKEGNKSFIRKIIFEEFSVLETKPKVVIPKKVYLLKLRKISK